MQPYSGTVKIDGKQIKWQTSFPNTVKFECQHCSHCCIATTVSVNKQEQKAFDKQDIEQKQLRPIIKGSDKEECRFHKSNKCNIYNKRPFVCREYPFKVCFVRPHIAIIDTVKTCKSMITESSKTEPDFNNLIKLAYNYNKQILDSIPLILSNLLEESDIKNIVEKSIDWPELRKTLFTLLKTDSAKPYKFYNTEKDDFFIIVPEETKVIIKSMNQPENTKKTKELDISEINNLELETTTKDNLIEYLTTIFNRHTTLMDFTFAMDKLIQNNINIDQKLLQIMTIEKIHALMMFFMNIVATSNNEQQISQKTLNKTIFMLDSSFLAPMEGIIQKYVK